MWKLKCLFVLAVLPVLFLHHHVVLAEGQVIDKPVVTVAISSVDQVLANCQEFRTSMQLGMGEIAALFKKLGVSKGLNRTRPVGLIVKTGGDSFRTFGFLPVHDRQTLIESLTQAWGELMDVGDAVVEIPAPVPVYARIENKWAFVATDAETLLEVPEDPILLLDGLEKEYDLAIRAQINNIPLIYRQLAIGWVQFAIQEEMSQLDGLEDLQSRLQRKMMQDSLVQFQSLVNETETISFGWDMLPSTKDMRFDVAITAVEGTSSAERMAGIKETVSRFSGFLLSDASVQLHFAADIPKDDTERTLYVLKAMKLQALDELQRDPEITDQNFRSDAQDVLGGLFDIVITAVEGEHIEGGAAMILEDDTFSLIAGGHVVNGADFAKRLRDFCELCDQDDGFPEVSWNVAEHRGVHFHRWEIPVGHPSLAPVVGERLEITLGTGEECGYLSVGSESGDLLKRVLDRSHQMKDSVVPPSQMSVSLRPIVRYLNQIDADNPNWPKLTNFLGGVNGRDRITMENKPIERGSLTQVTIERDVVRIVGQLMNQYVGQMINIAPSPLEAGREAGF